MNQLHWLMRPRRRASVALATLAGVFAFAGATSHTAEAPARAPVPASTARASSSLPVASVRTRPSTASRGAVAKATTAPPSGLASPTTPPATGGVIVALDPETGLPGLPTPEQVQALLGDRSQAFRTEDGLVQFQTPSGATGILLDSRFMEFAVVRIGPDGTKTFGCVHSSANLRDLASAPPPPALEEK